MMEKRGQVGFETIFIAGFLILFVIVMFLFIEERKLKVSETDLYLEYRNICQQLSNVITSIFTKGHGTSQTITLDTLYNIQINGPEQIVWINNKYTCTIPISSVSNGNSNLFEVYDSKISFYNFKGIVYVNYVPRECLDFDHDNYGFPGSDLCECNCGLTDCNDNNPLINPCAFEICKDGIDNNCDGIIDNC